MDSVAGREGTFIWELGPKYRTKVVRDRLKKIHYPTSEDAVTH